MPRLLRDYLKTTLRLLNDYFANISRLTSWLLKDYFMTNSSEIRVYPFCRAHPQLQLTLIYPYCNLDSSNQPTDHPEQKI